MPRVRMKPANSSFTSESLINPFMAGLGRREAPGCCSGGAELYYAGRGTLLRRARAALLRKARSFYCAGRAQLYYAVTLLRGPARTRGTFTAAADAELRLHATAEAAAHMP